MRRLIRRIETRPAPRPEPPPSRGLVPASLERTQERMTEVGGCAFLERRYPLTTRVGTQSLLGLDQIDAGVLQVLAPRETWAGSTGPLVILDIEATGLSGARIIAFLVATAVVVGDALLLRQYIARTPAEETAVLSALLADVDLPSDPVLVTYNGRSFDAPVLDDRATMHRLRGGFASAAHLDLLPPARLVFRDTVDSCRLKALEPAVLAFHRGEDDVPGSDVPAWYFRYLRTGDPRHLVPLVRHNAHDVLALGALLAAMGALLRGEREVPPEQALGLGRLHLKARNVPLALPWLQTAAETLDRPLLRREARERLAGAYKVLGRPAEAIPLWQALAAEGGPGQIAACIEIAKHLEHQQKDFAAARQATEEAIEIARQPSAAAWRQPLAHRLNRLLRRQRMVAAGG